MSSFKDITISGLGTTITGKTPSSDFPEDFGNEYLFITPSDNFDSKYISKTERYLSDSGLLKLKSKTLPQNSILVTCIGSAMGKVSMNKSIAVTNQQINSIVPNTEYFDIDYIYYLLKNNYKLLRNAANGSTALPLLNKTDFDSLKVKVHKSKDDQHKIASVLSALDDKIELNNRINDELEQFAKTIYDYWFVQFDFPDTQGKPYKASGGKMVYNEVLKTKIPDAWEVASLSNLAILNPTLSIKKNSLAPYIEMASIPTRGYMTSKPAQREFSGGVKFQNGDIIVARITPCLENGKTALITLLEKDAIGFGSTEFITVRGKNRSYTSFLAILARSEPFRNYAISKMTGTSGRKRVDAKDLCNFKLAIPPDHLLQKLGSILDVCFDKMRVNAKQNEEISALRDWLLPMLMNGQVKVDSSSKSSKESVLLASEYQTGYEKASQLTIPANKKGFAKQVLAGKIVSKFIDDRSLTDIKFQKIQFLAEHIIEADLNLNYYCQAAGPYDNKFMHTIYNDFRKQKWFDFKNNRFIPLEKREKIDGYFQGYFDSVQVQLNKLFDLLYNASEAEAEIIATIYAVWNNRIIERRTTADEELITDFYLWSDRKKQYTKKQVSTGLQWLRKHQMEPQGFGKLIKRANAKS